MDNIYPKPGDIEGLVANFLWRLFPDYFGFVGYEGNIPLPSITEIGQRLTLDAEFAFESDPAATSVDEIILCYPGFLAIAVHRLH